MIGGSLGTPTSRAKSGTVEEIRNAVSRQRPAWARHDVQVYFKRNQVTALDADVVEIDRIQKFRKELGSKGVLYSEYDKSEELQLSVRQATRRCVTSWISNQAGDYVSHSQQLASQKDIDDEEGLLDYQEQFEAAIAEASECLEKGTDKLNEFGAFTVSQTALLPAQNSKGVSEIHQ